MSEAELIEAENNFRNVYNREFRNFEFNETINIMKRDFLKLIELVRKQNVKSTA